MSADPSRIVERQRKELSELSQKIGAAFGSIPKYEPTAFAAGVVEQLREIALAIETGEVTVTHFLYRFETEEAGQRLEIEVA